MDVKEAGRRPLLLSQRADLYAKREDVPEIFGAATAGLAAVACLAFAPQNHALPALPWAAAYLIFAIQVDVRRQDIPNWLTLPFLVLALGLAANAGGHKGLIAALAGAVTGCVFLFVPFTLRWLAAGHVKAAAVLGALWGAAHFLGALWWAAIVCVLVGLVLSAARDGVFGLPGRWRESFGARLAARPPACADLLATGPARVGLPFGVAVALGAAAYQVWGSPWA